MRRIGMLGAASAALYGVNYALQRSMSPLHAGPSLRATAIGYLVVTVALFATYAIVAVLACRGALESGRARTVALVWPVAIALALTFGRPYLSIDVFAYIAQGHQALEGANPYVESLREAADSPYGRELQHYGWLPVHGRSPYGPLWTLVEASVVRTVSTIPAQVRLLKVVATLLLLASAWVIWSILAVVSPARRVAGTVLYLWNPAVLAELAGEGHNDGAMIFFAVLSILFFVRKREGLGVVALGVGALFKIVAALVAPLELIFAWRSGSPRRLWVGIAIGGACVAMLAAVSYAPFWVGPATLEGLREHSRPGILASTQGLLYWMLTRSHSEQASARLLSLSADAAFLACAAGIGVTVRDARTLLRGCGWLAVVYLVLAPGYWPWYACLPIALLALAPSPISATAIAALALASRLAAPIDALRLDGLMTWTGEVALTTVVGVWLPAAAIAAAAVRRAMAPPPAPAAFVRQEPATARRLVN